MDSAIARTAEETRRPSVSVERASVLGGDRNQRSPSRKRSASSTLEHSPTKVAKTVEGGAESRDASEGMVVNEAVVPDETIETLKLKLDQKDADLVQMKEKAKRIIGERKTETADWKNRATEAEVELAQLREDYKTLQKLRGSKNTKEYQTTLAESITKKNDAKMAELKKKHGAAIDDMKERMETAEQEAKDARNELTRKEKERTKELAQFKKELKAEQTAEIRQFKQDNSGEIKEKREQFKQIQKKIEAHEKGTKTSGEEIGTLQAEVARLKDRLRRSQESKQDLQNVLKKKEDFLAEISAEYAKEANAHQAELNKEKRKREHAEKNCQELVAKCMELQRELFKLKIAVDSGKVECLQKLMEKMASLRGMAPFEMEGEEAEKQQPSPPTSSPHSAAAPPEPGTDGTAKTTELKATAGLPPAPKSTTGESRPSTAVPDLPTPKAAVKSHEHTSPDPTAVSGPSTSLSAPVSRNERVDSPMREQGVQSVGEANSQAAGGKKEVSELAHGGGKDQGDIFGEMEDREPCTWEA